MIFDLIAGLLSGILGSMGLGGGAVLLIYLALIKNADQLSSQGINLIFFIPIALFSVICYAVKRQIKWKAVIWLSVSGLAGALVGVWLSGVMGTELVAKIFGGLLAVAGVFQAVGSLKKKKTG